MWTRTQIIPFLDGRYEQWRFDGRLNDKSHTDRTLQVELRGFQGDEQVAIDELAVIGVAGEEESA